MDVPEISSCGNFWEHAGNTKTARQLWHGPCAIAAGYCVWSLMAVPGVARKGDGLAVADVCLAWCWHLVMDVCPA